MSDAAQRDVMKRTMLENDRVSKNKSNSSGSGLGVNNSNGLSDLNELLERHSEPVVLSRDVTNSHNGRRNITDVQGNHTITPIYQQHLRPSNYLGSSSVGSNAPSPDLNELLERNSEPVVLSRDVTNSHTGRRNITNVQGNDRISQIDQLHLLSPNHAFQPRTNPVTDHSNVKISEEGRAYGKLEIRSKNPQVSYDSYLGSSSVVANAPRLNNEFLNPWSLRSSPWENHMSSSQPYSVETNGLYQGFSSGYNQSVFNAAEPRRAQEYLTYSRNQQRDPRGLYQRFSSGCNQSLFNAAEQRRAQEDFTHSRNQQGDPQRLYQGFPSGFNQPVFNAAEPQRAQEYLTYSRNQQRDPRGLYQRFSSGCNQSVFNAAEPRRAEEDVTHSRYQQGDPRRLYQGFSSGCNQSVFNFPSTGFKPNFEGVKSQSFESLQGPRKQERSAGFPCFEPQRNEISHRWFDLNDSNRTRNNQTSASAHRGLSSASYSNTANMGRVDLINTQSSTRVSNPFISHSLSIADQHKEVRHSVKPDRNTPSDASDSLNQHHANAKKEGKKAANEVNQDSGLFKLKIKTRDLKDSAALPSLENKGESSQEKPNEKTRGLKQGHDEAAAKTLVAISSSNGQRLLHDAATNEPLSRLADIAYSLKDEGKRDKSSSEGSDYFEIMTLKTQPMTEEEYMPRPLFPEHLKFEEETSTNQPRKNLGRKGKKNTDFQKDILPVISTLSRREITEDFQMFELMKPGDGTLRSGMATRRNRKRKQMVELEDSKPTGRGQETKREAAMRQKRDPAGKFCKKT